MPGAKRDPIYAAYKDEIAEGLWGNLSGDYYRYDLTSISSAPFNFMVDQMGGTPSPSLSKPVMHDWEESGVLEAECLMCHTDPLQNRLTTHDGVQVQNYSPMLKAFLIAKINGAGDDYEDIKSHRG